MSISRVTSFMSSRGALTAARLVPLLVGRARARCLSSGSGPPGGPAEPAAATQLAKAEAGGAVAAPQAAAGAAAMAAAAVPRSAAEPGAKVASAPVVSEPLAGERQSAATVVAAFVGVAGLLAVAVGTHLWGSAQAAEQALAVRRFERRRVDAIKARILSPPVAVQAREPPSSAPPALDDFFSRPEALLALAGISTKAGIYMVVGPKGEGKTTLVSQFVAATPHVLYVDLQDGSMDKAVRAVAAALGYDMTDSVEEAGARQRGFALPDLQALQSTDTYEALLHAFERACAELRAEGRLAPGCCPVLVLDHANRPLRRGAAGAQPQRAPEPPLHSALLDTALPASADANLMYSTVEIGHRFANRRTASLVMVSSDLLQELDAWRRAGGCDSVRYIRVAPFSDADAACLLARRIFASSSKGHARQPSGSDLADIQRQYASTIATITATLGTRARWLVQALAHDAHAPLADAELASRGASIPARYLPCLPSSLQGASVRVDPGVWAALQALIEARRQEARGLLSVSEHMALPPSPQAEPGATRLAQRLLAIDAALRALLHAPLPRSELEGRYFSAAEHVLRRLCEQHVVFYNHDTMYVEIESPLVRRVVGALLASSDHQQSMELVRQLLGWLAAAQARAELQQLLAAEQAAGRGQGGWFAAPAPDVVDLERELFAARGRERLARQGVDAARAALQALRC
jgi:hypothetical protein